MNNKIIISFVLSSFSFSALAAMELHGFGSAYHYSQKTTEPNYTWTKGNIHQYSKVGLNFA